MSDTLSTNVLSSSLRGIGGIFRPAFWFGGNWNREIANSDLPGDVQSRIRHVVSKSRLRRPEKYDVAQELVQHFQDGHRKGVTFDQLAEEFGDLDSAALLIRRAKIRNRSWLGNVVRSIPRVIACLSVPYLALLWYYHHGQPSPSVDYTVSLKQHVITVAEQDKAWPLYRPMWIKYQLGVNAKGKYAEMRTSMYVDEPDRWLVHPSDSQWPQVVEMLEEHREFLEVYREGAKRKSFGLELQANARDYSDEDFDAIFASGDKAGYKNYWEDYESAAGLDGAMISVLTPHVDLSLSIALLFQLDTRLAVIERDADRVVRNVEAVLGVASQIGGEPMLGSYVSALSIRQVAFEQLEEILLSKPNFFSESQLLGLQDAVAVSDVREWLDYEADHVMIKDLIQRCYTDDGNGSGRVTSVGMKILKETTGTIAGLSGRVAVPQPVDYFRWIKDTWSRAVKSELTQSALAPGNLFTFSSRKEVLAKAEELFEEIKADQGLPFWMSRSSMPDGWEFLYPDEHAFLTQVMPPIQAIDGATVRAVAHKNAMLAALAMYRYHLANRQWPVEEAEIVPKFLEEMPVDVLTGKPLHLKIVGDRPLVYSVGVDHDDDGGVDATRTGTPLERSRIKPGPKNADFEGDWILWPLKGRK